MYVEYPNALSLSRSLTKSIAQNQIPRSAHVLSPLAWLTDAPLSPPNPALPHKSHTQFRQPQIRFVSWSHYRLTITICSCQTNHHSNENCIRCFCDDGILFIAFFSSTFNSNSTNDQHRNLSIYSIVVVVLVVSFYCSLLFLHWFVLYFCRCKDIYLSIGAVDSFFVCSRRDRYTCFTTVHYTVYIVNLYGKLGSL